MRIPKKSALNSLNGGRGSSALDGLPFPWHTHTRAFLSCELLRLRLSKHHILLVEVEIPASLSAFVQLCASTCTVLSRTVQRWFSTVSTRSCRRWGCRPRRAPPGAASPLPPVASAASRTAPATAAGVSAASPLLWLQVKNVSRLTSFQQVKGQNAAMRGGDRENKAHLYTQHRECLLHRRDRKHTRFYSKANFPSFL